MNVKLTRLDDERLQLVRKMLDKDFKSHFTIQQLASKFGINDFKLKHGFKHTFGITIYKYLVQKRMEYAIELLRDDNDLKIYEAADKSGFDDISTFNRVFRRKFKMTPSEWRKNNVMVNGE